MYILFVHTLKSYRRSDIDIKNYKIIKLKIKSYVSAEGGT